MYKEYSFRAKAKVPSAPRNFANLDSYDDFLTNQWRLVDHHADQGGSPEIVGVVSINATKNTINIPHYRLRFPNGTIDYARVDNFNVYYEFALNI